MDFSRVQACGRRYRGQHLMLVAASRPPQPETPGAARVGFAVGRKVGNAVVRNRVKRRLREAVRSLGGRFPPRSDFVIIAYASAASAAYSALTDDLSALVARLPR